MVVDAALKSPIMEERLNVSTPILGANAPKPAANADGKAQDNQNQSLNMSETDAASSNEPSADDSEPKEDFNKRLLDESKEWKRKALENKRELDLIKRSKMEAEGKVKELWEQDKSKIQNLEKKLLRKSVEDTIKGAAQKAGCTNVQMLMRLAKMEMLTINQTDDFEFEVSGADSLVEEVKKELPDLFRSAKPVSVNPAVPGGPSGPRDVDQNSFWKLPGSERQDVWAQAYKKLRGE